MFISSTKSVMEIPPVVNRKSLQFVKMNFSEWLKEQRDKASLTQGELSDRTEGLVSVSMISSIESGTRRASLTTVNRLARALGANRDEARIAAGFAPEQPLERDKPQTVSELLSRLDELGVGINHGGLESLPDDPDTLAAILQDIETVLALRARRKLPPHDSDTGALLPR
jgi:transcriptional regulator with XRE-family HTH domain